MKMLVFIKPYVFLHLCDVYYVLCHPLQLAEPSPDSAGVGGETEHVGDHKATTPSGYSNIEAIEMTAAGIVSCCPGTALPRRMYSLG